MIFSTNPLMVSRLKYGNKMNSMPIAETKNTDINALTDND